MVKQILAWVVVCGALFFIGTVVGEKRSDVDVKNQFVTPDGRHIPFDEIPDFLREQAEHFANTEDMAVVDNTAIDQLMRGLPPADTEVQYYESPFGFRVQYDSRLQAENSWVVLPNNQRIAAFAVVRYVRMQDCTESGLAEHCRPMLENPAIAFGVADEKPSSLVTSQLGVIAKHLEPVTINGITAAQYYASAEGEGVVTMLVPLTDGQRTLVIQYTYDTQYDTNAPHEDILTSAEQKQLVDTVLKTLTLQ